MNVSGGVQTGSAAQGAASERARRLIGPRSLRMLAADPADQQSSGAGLLATFDAIFQQIQTPTSPDASRETAAASDRDEPRASASEDEREGADLERAEEGETSSNAPQDLQADVFQEWGDLHGAVEVERGELDSDDAEADMAGQLDSEQADAEEQETEELTGPLERAPVSEDRQEVAETEEEELVALGAAETPTIVGDEGGEHSGRRYSEATEQDAEMHAQRASDEGLTGFGKPVGTEETTGEESDLTDAPEFEAETGWTRPKSAEAGEGGRDRHHRHDRRAADEPRGEVQTAGASEPRGVVDGARESQSGEGAVSLRGADWDFSAQSMSPGMGAANVAATAVAGQAGQTGQTAEAAGATVAKASAGGERPVQATEGNRGQPTSRLDVEGPSRQAGVAGGKKAAEAKADPLSAMQRVRLVQRVARSFQRLGPEGGQVNMMLHPAELGSVRLRMRMDGQQMEATLTTQTTAAMEVLREHMPDLRHRLQEMGMEVERIEVRVDAEDATSLDARSDDSRQQAFSGQSWSDQRDSAWNGITSRRGLGRAAGGNVGAEPEAAVQSASRGVPSGSRSGIDLRF